MHVIRHTGLGQVAPYSGVRTPLNYQQQIQTQNTCGDFVPCNPPTMPAGGFTVSYSPTGQATYYPGSVQPTASTQATAPNNMPLIVAAIAAVVLVVLMAR